MIESRTKISVSNVSYISTWGTIDFQTPDGMVEISLTDEQISDFAEKLTSRAKDLQERKIRKMRDELEKLNESEATD